MMTEQITDPEEGQDLDPRRLYSWTIYYDPVDHPGKYVVRRHTLDRGIEPIPATKCTVHDTLDEARLACPIVQRCMVRFPQGPHDPPKIVETYL